ncbi:angio-associated migratory cell protein isoform X1 [Bombus affinis]|uniref:Angio-associated migratory cell protein isoform X1 n=2 Tax=Bombus terrestris TaxID=30195 RepID=A0A6P3U6B4_BOMTE|nr:angio-associated migratory cell protein isoform X1 [Bombus terrestris]XP_012169713.1 angio-associated migratory cell protein isoform X1 [Bombus terrestris]XP_048266435.1 angio-associated migratory cell protein isoform X1 [Bombus terrestris]XP_050579658.1 angio-associated migratory cell protein isoform X1 [Bombus affinis]XP_050579659.1 angio-associated migratory cell protein isoform X1 [Bombus affinis]XP_050579660.1 angio-associated migratory cell protein isoform X1 [Bombus affinis]
MHTDTPPFSSDMANQINEEDMIYIGDVEEVIDDEEDAMEEDPSEEGDAICVFSSHEIGSVFCGSLNKNGKLATTGGEEDKAYIWDTSSGEIILDCTGHKDSIIFSAFNHDESYLATGDMSGMIQVWKLADKTKIWDYNMGDATWMMWHTVANILLAGSVDGEIYMWKIPDGDCKVFQGYGCRAETGSIFPDGKRIAVGYEDGVIRILDLKTSSVLSSISSALGHSSTITTIDCHWDNNLILSAAVDGKTIISTSNTGKIVSILQNLNNGEHNNVTNNDQSAVSSEGNRDSNWVETAAFCKNPAFQVAATGTVNGEIFIWDISKQMLRQKIEQESGISKLLWKGNTTLLFSAGLDGILRCFDGKDGLRLRSFFGHMADILDLYISENGEKALTTSDDSTARIFDISSLS